MKFYQVALSFVVLATVASTAVLVISSFTGRTGAPPWVVAIYTMISIVCIGRVMIGKPDFKSELRSVVQKAFAKHAKTNDR